MNLRIPHYRETEHPSFEQLLDGVLEHDQFDDWWPDVLYWNDRRQFKEEQLRDIETLCRKDNADLPAPVILPLPRESGSTLQAGILPLELRLLVHLVSGAFAMRLVKRDQDLLRDKVFGFFYRHNKIPPFSLPGEEFDEALDQAIEASRGWLYVCDIRSFNQSARVNTLLEELTKRGLRADAEKELIDFALRIPGGGLPSVDDASAYLYNFYLDTIDHSLFRVQQNFVRYRDEYFLFEYSDVARLTKLLAECGLDVRVSELNTGDAASDLEEKLTPDKDPVTATVVTLSHGQIVDECTCLGWAGRVCTDGYEHTYHLVPPETAVQTLWSQRPEGFDAVALLPLLRAVHKARRSHAHLAADAASASREFEAYRRQVLQGRNRLLEFARAGVAANQPWVTAWSCRLLSDAAPLGKTESAALRELLKTGVGHPLADWEIRLALARSTDLPPQDLWVRPVKSDVLQLRCAGLAACWWRRRSHGTPWTTVEADLRQHDPLCHRMLAQL